MADQGVNYGQILNVAQKYLTLQKKANVLARSASDELLSGSAGSAYLKRMGHRPLTTEDVERLINTLGSEEDRKALSAFQQAQELLNQRLWQTKNIGLVLEQAAIPYDLFYKRKKRPDLWKPEQMISIVDVLQRLRL
ncbi:hypothetical protein GCM10023189_45530 [Nibrella saemangeumensis]|uniref:Uncharacterized protein n=1 Tax=Nibrella saemangeumensis TaxID=1084526 RepID=A0ABP8NFZ7_9BACT